MGLKEQLTLVVITKNEEATLSECLGSAAWIPNIVVVDSGSTDKTLEIAKCFGATIVSQDWLGFGPQKRFAVNKAPTDWVLCLDADEFLSKELSESIQKLFTTEPQEHAYRFARSNKFLGKYLKHGEGYPDWSLRLFNRKVAQWSEDLVHEKVVGMENDLKIGKLSGDLMHNSSESISKYIQKQNAYTDIQAQKLIESNKSISSLNLVFSPLVRFIKYYFIKGGFLDGFPGFVHISIGCFFVLMKYAKAMKRVSR